MNYTEKYHLPQWEKSDRILMDDFNQMCLDMEAGLEKTAQTASSGSNSAAQAAKEAAAAAEKAQSTADSALEKAQEAYSARNKPYVVGGYTGNDEEWQTIQLSFTPSLVIVGGLVTNGLHFNQTTAGGFGSSTKYLQIVSGGFQVSGGPAEAEAKLNKAGVAYSYIAFR